MATQPEIIPLCLYSNSTNSYIGLPVKVIVNGKVDYTCPPISGMEFKGKFYVLNPDIKPKPTSIDLFCVSNFREKTLDIRLFYDPFNRDEKCLQFLAWLEPTPCTIPLYISKRVNDIYISFDKKLPNSEYIPYNIIYVLADPKLDLQYFNCQSKFQSGDNGPQFMFTQHYGRCIPDPLGSLKLSECMVLYNKNIIDKDNEFDHPHILNYIDSRYGKKPFKNLLTDTFIVITCLILIIIISFIVLKN